MVFARHRKSAVHVFANIVGISTETAEGGSRLLTVSTETLEITVSTETVGNWRILVTCDRAVVLRGMINHFQDIPCQTACGAQQPLVRLASPLPELDEPLDSTSLIRAAKPLAVWVPGVTIRKVPQVVEHQVRLL